MDFLEMREALVRAMTEPESEYSHAYRRIKESLMKEGVKADDAHEASLRITNIVWDIYLRYAKDVRPLDEFLSRISSQISSR